MKTCFKSLAQFQCPLAMKLLDGEFKPGDRIRATAADAEIIFEKK